MGESVFLHGSEDVMRAAGIMREAAETFAQAASNWEAAMEQQRRYMDEWIVRFADAVGHGVVKD